MTRRDNITRWRAKGPLDGRGMLQGVCPLTRGKLVIPTMRITRELVDKTDKKQ